MREGTLSIVPVPLPYMLGSGLHEIRTIWTVILSVESAEESGLGYALAFEESEARAISAEVESLFSYVAAPDLGIRETWRRMWRQINHIGQAGPPLFALSMIDTALWDLAARRMKLPLYQLLGGERTQFALYGSGGWLTYSVEELLLEAEKFATAGYRAYKMKIGNSDWTGDLERVSRVIELVGDRMKVMVDLNQSWTASEVITKIGALEELGVAWVEEPVDCVDLRGLEMIQGHSPVRLAAGETLTLIGCVRDLIEPRRVAVVMPDLMRCGGPSGMSEVMMAARLGHVELSPHLFPEVSAHVASAFYGPVLVEDIVGGWAEACFDSQAIRHEGQLDISGCVGIGLRPRSDLKPSYELRLGGPTR